MSESTENKTSKPGVFSMVMSVLAAFLGVQTEKTANETSSMVARKPTSSLALFLPFYSCLV